MIPFVILAIENDSDRDFMEKLYLEYNLLMYSEAKNIVESQWDAEEIVQTVVEKLINHISKLRGMTRECRVNYIITAVINCALSQKARDKRISLWILRTSLPPMWTTALIWMTALLISQTRISFMPRGGISVKRPNGF